LPPASTADANLVVAFPSGSATRGTILKAVVNSGFHNSTATLSVVSLEALLVDLGRTIRESSTRSTNSHRGRHFYSGPVGKSNVLWWVTVAVAVEIMASNLSACTSG